MSLEVVVASSDPYLTTTAAVKEWLGTTSTASDAKLSSLILQASAWAAGVVGYPLTLAKYRETVAAYGTRHLMLARTPVRSVSALYYGTDTGEAEQVFSSAFGIDREAGFLSQNAGWEWTVPVTFQYEPRPLVGQEYEPWLVDYAAGFTLGLSTDSALWSTEKGTTSTGRTLPYDIEQAVIMKVANIHTGNDGVFSKKVGDLQITYGSGRVGGEVSDPAAAVLRRYARTA